MHSASTYSSLLSFVGCERVALVNVETVQLEELPMVVGTLRIYGASQFRPSGIISNVT